MQYVAFLRGINLNGRTVKMEDLQKVFIDLGYHNVETLIASGNVIFSSSETNEEVLQKTIKDALDKRFTFHIPVIIRTKEEIEQLLILNPFKEIKIEKGIRLQVTLFGERIKGAPTTQNGFIILHIGERELASVVLPEGKTTDLMTFIDKTFGKNSTTRNWNTIQKIGTMQL